MLTCSYGQKVKQQKWGNKFYREAYTVLKTDKSIRHGEYNNFKNGLLNIEGHYSNNKKIDIWKYYINNNIVQSYDFTKDSIISRGPSGIVYQVFEGNQVIDKKLDKEPTYIGGKPNLERALNDVMEYPEHTRRIGLEGEVEFALELDDAGVVRGLEFIKGPKEFYDEIKKGLTEIEQLWIPGSSNKSKYKCRLQYTIVFSLLDCGNYGCATIFIK